MPVLFLDANFIIIIFVCSFFLRLCFDYFFFVRFVLKSAGRQAVSLWFRKRQNGAKQNDTNIIGESMCCRTIWIKIHLSSLMRVVVFQLIISVFLFHFSHLFPFSRSYLICIVVVVVLFLWLYLIFPFLYWKELFFIRCVTFIYSVAPLENE